MAISRAVLEEVYDRLNEAVGAVEKLNTRIVANTRLWGCTDAIFRTGKASAGCPKPATAFPKEGDLEAVRAAEKLNTRIAAN